MISRRSLWALWLFIHNESRCKASLSLNAFANGVSVADVIGDIDHGDVQCLAIFMACLGPELFMVSPGSTSYIFAEIL
jgi:hypothetical protein